MPKIRQGKYQSCGMLDKRMTFVNMNAAASTGIHHKLEVFMIRFLCLTLAGFLARSAPGSAQTVLRVSLLVAFPVIALWLSRSMG